LDNDIFSASFVSKVITGGGHSPKVLDALLELGVPEKLLFDPRTFTGEQKREVA